MESAATQTRFLLREHDLLIGSLENRDRAFEPAPGTKTAGWIVGHLVVTGDFARRLCGLLPIAPKEWRTLFSPGTHPSTDPAVYPEMAAMVAAFRDIYTDLAAKAPTATGAGLSEPNPYVPARPVFPTGGDFAKYLLSGHLGYHLGQLSSWRAVAAGVDPALRQP